MNPPDQLATSHASSFVEKRCHERFKQDIEIKVYSRSSVLQLGRTVDISDGGTSALLKIETPINEVVQLEFIVPFGAVSVQALVRHKSAFRYGFQFLEPDPGAQKQIKRTTCQLGAGSTFREPGPGGYLWP